MSENFTAAIGHFFIIVAAIVVVLVILLILGTLKKPRRALHRILPQKPPNEKHKELEFNLEYYTRGERVMRRPMRGKNAPRKVTAMLVQKVDERRRTTDPSGNSKLYNEYYELIFKSRDGEIHHLVTSKRTYADVPFHKEGQLTYQGDALISFRFSGGEVEEDSSLLRSSYYASAPPRRR